MSVEGKSTADLFRDLSNEMTSLVHQEVDLAKVEPIRNKKRTVGMAAGVLFLLMMVRRRRRRSQGST